MGSDITHLILSEEELSNGSIFSPKSIPPAYIRPRDIILRRPFIVTFGTEKVSLKLTSMFRTFFLISLKMKSGCLQPCNRITAFHCRQYCRVGPVVHPPVEPESLIRPYRYHKNAWTLHPTLRGLLKEIDWINR